MELRHLRYFIAAAEEGSLKLAAEKRLRTAQPSLSRQIRDLEREVGAQLLQRSARGVELTAAGRTFLEHARLSIVSRCLSGEQPLIDLVLGFHKANKSRVLGPFLSRIAELSAHIRSMAGRID